MKTAYLILVHRYPQQFMRLFRAIYHPINYYLIHVDKRARGGLHTEIQDFLASFSNAHLLESRNVVWGGYSMVDVELRGIKELLKISVEWDFFINLSGQDYPLRSQAFIQDFLCQNEGTDFIQIFDQAKKRPDTMNRVENYFIETDNGFSGTPYKRLYLPDVTPYIGGQWMILSRGRCEFICGSGEVEKLKSFYRNTLIPDEGFFQTVIMNTSYSGAIVNDDKRAIIWIPDGDIKLRPKTFRASDINFLLASDALFARKFDETVDSTIFDILESKLQISNYTLANQALQRMPATQAPLSLGVGQTKTNQTRGDHFDRTPKHKSREVVGAAPGGRLAN